MKNTEKQKAAGGWQPRATFATGSGEAFSVPQAHSSTPQIERQERIIERLASDHRRAQVLAAHHLSLAERFQQEAEAMADLLRQGEHLQ